MAIDDYDPRTSGTPAPIPHEHTAQDRVNREEEDFMDKQKREAIEREEKRKLEGKQIGKYNMSNIMEGLERLHTAMREQGAHRFEVNFNGGKVVWEKVWKDEAEE